MTIKQQLLAVTRQLLPTGRAFRIGYNSVNEAVEKALILSEERAYNDGIGILDTILPDNDNFTVEDATRWEQRLGMITNDLVSLQDRKDAIIRKMNHPGDILARQSAGYIQDSLQLAGFNVWVHENIPEQSPLDVLNGTLGLGEMGEPEMDELEMGGAETYYSDLFIISEMGEIEMGEAEMNGFQYTNIIANNIEEIPDSTFDVGQNFRCCFFIGGQTFGTFATVDINRKDEFRQLVLKLKPVQTVGILFINYV